MAEASNTSLCFDSCSTGTPLTEFQLFPELPIELRLQIWEHTIAPRLVNIDDLCGDRGPAVLRVNQESRSVSRPEYEVFQATRVRDNEKVGFFVNLSVDYFNVCQFTEEYNRRWQIVAILNIISCRYPPWLDQAQRVAISISSEVHSGYPSSILEQTWRALNKQFPDLKELVLVMDLEQDARYDELVAIPRGAGKLGQIVEKFEDGMKVAQGKGLCKILKLSFMRVKPTKEALEEEARDLLVMKDQSSRKSQFLRTMIVQERDDAQPADGMNMGGW